MADLFTRPEERSHETPGRTPGVLVVLPDGRRLLFPGGRYGEDYSTDLALAFARRVLSGGELDHPETRVEVGYRRGDDWVCEKKLKIPNTPSQPKAVDPAEQGWG